MQDHNLCFAGGTKLNVSLAADATMTHDALLDQIDRQIGLRIKQRRRALRISQSVLAKMIGVSFQQIHKYETGRSSVSAARLFTIAQALETDPGVFFGQPDSEGPGRC
jgi:DNA-binding transcriptional regulator YiaG